MSSFPPPPPIATVHHALLAELHLEEHDVEPEDTADRQERAIYFAWFSRCYKAGVLIPPCDRETVVSVVQSLRGHLAAYARLHCEQLVGDVVFGGSDVDDERVVERLLFIWRLWSLRGMLSALREDARLSTHDFIQPTVDRLNKAFVASFDKDEVEDESTFAPANVTTRALSGSTRLAHYLLRTWPRELPEPGPERDDTLALENVHRYVSNIRSRIKKVGFKKIPY